MLGWEKGKEAEHKWKRCKKRRPEGGFEIPFHYEAPIISTEWGGRPAQSSITHIRLPMPLTDQ